MTMDNRPLTDRLAGSHHWASGIHASLEQLATELDDLGQQRAVKRLATAQQQLELVCADLDSVVESGHGHTFPARTRSAAGTDSTAVPGDSA